MGYSFINKNFQRLSNLCMSERQSSGLHTKKCKIWKKNLVKSPTRDLPHEKV